MVAHRTSETALIINTTSSISNYNNLVEDYNAAKDAYNSAGDANTASRLYRKRRSGCRRAFAGMDLRS